MEIDYYDYNVANAGAAPGSYLGMDPAFLLWIPPLSMSEDFGGPSTDRSDYFQGTMTTNSLYQLSESTEGASLTPAEYRQIRQQFVSSIEETRLSFEQKRQESTFLSSSKNDTLLSGSDSTCEDSISNENKITRLNEHLLSIHRILENSRIRVSEESLCGPLMADKTACVIPNCLHTSTSDSSSEKDISKSNWQGGYVNNADNVPVKSDDKLETSKQILKQYSEDVALYHESSKHANQKAKNISQENKKNSSLKNDNMFKFFSKSTSLKTQEYKDIPDDKDKDFQNATNNSKLDISLTNLASITGSQCKYRDFTQFTKPHETKLSDCTNIPMVEFSEPRLSLPATARILKMDNINISLKKEIQSPDYGVESDMKIKSRESFYNLVRENENSIKFADDDDEYIDNRTNL